MASHLYPVLLVCSFLVAGGYGQTFCEMQTGAGRSCFSEPAACVSEAECEMTMTSMGVENSTRFTLSGKSEGWVAIGFSGDQKMGDDDVIMCIRDGSDDSVELLDRFNDGRSNVAKDNPAIGAGGLELEASDFTDGVISCEFIRKNAIMPVDPQHVGLRSEINFYILFGRGPVNNGDPSMHETIPWYSESQVNLSATSIIARGGLSITTPTSGPNTITGGRMDMSTVSPSSTRQAKTTSGAVPSQQAAYLVLHLVVANLMMLMIVY